MKFILFSKNNVFILKQQGACHRCTQPQKIGVILHKCRCQSIKIIFFPVLSFVHLFVRFEIMTKSRFSSDCVAEMLSWDWARQPSGRSWVRPSRHTFYFLILVWWFTKKVMANRCVDYSGLPRVEQVLTLSCRWFDVREVLTPGSDGWVRSCHLEQTRILTSGSRMNNLQKDARRWFFQWYSTISLDFTKSKHPRF
jgi:hypothetical protein